jgi:hypothetical protein
MTHPDWVAKCLNKGDDAKKSYFSVLEKKISHGTQNNYFIYGYPQLQRNGKIEELGNKGRYLRISYLLAEYL